MRITFKDNISIALKNITANRMRSFLTTLGVIIGTGSVVFLMSIGGGVEKFVLTQITGGTDTNIMFVEPGKQEGLMNEAMFGINITALKPKDLDALQNTPVIEVAAPAIIGNGTIQYQNVSQRVDFVGTTPDYQIVGNTSPAVGSFITEDDVRSRARVVVLGNDLAQDVFGGREAVGETVKINGVPLRVTGVLSELGARGFQNRNKFAILPYTTVQTQLLKIDHINAIIAQFSEDVSSETAKAEVTQVLRASHRLTPSQENDFTVTTEEEARQILGAVTGALTIFLTAIAAISLIVGGIGIMNIMLVSVKERTKEIGLRKAVGARNKDVLYQFLSEAIVFTLLGGGIGIAGGIGLSFIVSLIAQYFGFNWPFVIPVQGVVLSFAVAAVVGIVFGLYPAKKAASLSPIEALRYE